MVCWQTKPPKFNWWVSGNAATKAEWLSSKEHSSCAWKLRGQTCSSGRGVRGDAEDFYTNPAISQEVGCHIVDGWHCNSIQNCNTFVTWELGCNLESHSDIKIVELKDETQVGGRENGMFLWQTIVVWWLGGNKISHDGQGRLRKHPHWGHRSCGWAREIDRVTTCR